MNPSEKNAIFYLSYKIVFLKFKTLEISVVIVVERK